MTSSFVLFLFVIRTPVRMNMLPLQSHIISQIYRIPKKEKGVKSSFFIFMMQKSSVFTESENAKVQIKDLTPSALDISGGCSEVTSRRMN